MTNEEAITVLSNLRRGQYTPEENYVIGQAVVLAVNALKGSQRIHGYWIQSKKYHGEYFCSCCGHDSSYNGDGYPNDEYCSSCGAIMDGR